MASKIDESLETELEKQNEETVKALYKELSANSKGNENVARLVASDLEWWFHGPQNCQHMMRQLTGESSRFRFKFEPQSITTIDGRVIVEGWEGAQAYWVHVWTLKDGLITQFREYFNTWLTVTEFRPLLRAVDGCRTLWQSMPRDLAKRSLPGLMLVI